MTRKAHRTYTLDEVLADYSGEVCELALELRGLVRDAVPEAVETVRWGGIAYHCPERGGFVKAGVCGIGLFDDHVRLVFIHGKYLPDPEGLLEDAGRKHMRHVTVRSMKDIRRGAFRKLLRASLAFRPESLEGGDVGT